MTKTLTEQWAIITPEDCQEINTWISDYKKKIADLSKTIKHLQELLSQEEDRIRSLLERVGEADKIIKYYAEKHGKLKACDYLNKWGVK